MTLPSDFRSVLVRSAVALCLCLAFTGPSMAQLGVSPAGDATYRREISLPPGVRGIEPKLALSYSSHNAVNGPVGYPKGDRDARRAKEQQAINDRGGVDKLDNKRNEVAPKNWPSKGITPPGP